VEYVEEIDALLELDHGRSGRRRGRGVEWRVI